MKKVFLTITLIAFFGSVTAQNEDRKFKEKNEIIFFKPTYKILTTHKELKKFETMNFYELKKELLNFREAYNGQNEHYYLDNVVKFESYFRKNDLSNAKIILKNIYLKSIA